MISVDDDIKFEDSSQSSSFFSNLLFPCFFFGGRRRRQQKHTPCFFSKKHFRRFGSGRFSFNEAFQSSNDLQSAADALLAACEWAEANTAAELALEALQKFREYLGLKFYIIFGDDLHPQESVS